MECNTDGYERRLTKAEDNIDTLFGKFNGLNAAQVKTDTTLEHLLIAIGELKGAVQALQSRPGGWWDKLVGAVFAAIAAGLAAALIGALIK